MSVTTRAFLLSVLRDHMSLDVDDASLVDDLPLGSNGLDLESLGFTELVVHAEQRFGVTIPDEDMDVISSCTVREFVEYLDKRRSGSGADDQIAG